MHELFPPIRYRAVNEDVYAGAYPTLRNLRFMRRLQLRTIISLIPEKPTTDLREFCEHEKIEIIHIHTEKYKNCVSLTFADISKIIEMLIDTRLHPIYIHCLDGRHVTSLVIMCLRKLQNWNQKTIVKEAERYTEEFSSEDLDILKQWKGEITMPDAQFLPRKWLNLPSPNCEKKDRQHPKGIKLVGYFEQVEEKKLHGFVLEENRRKTVAPSINEKKPPSYVEAMIQSTRKKVPNKRSETKRVSIASLALEVGSTANLDQMRQDTEELEIPIAVRQVLEKYEL